MGTHTHTLSYCCEFQESKRLKCPSLVSTLKVRRNCTSSSLFCLRKLQFAGVLSFKGANSTSQHPFQLHPSGKKTLTRTVSEHAFFLEVTTYFKGLKYIISTEIEEKKKKKKKKKSTCVDTTA